MVSATGSSSPKKSTGKSQSLSDLLNKEGSNQAPKDAEVENNDSTENTSPDENVETVDNKEENKSSTVFPKDIKPPVDNTEKPNSTQTDDNDKADKPALSQNVVSTVPDKTPAELSAETPAQTAARYGVDQTISDEDADNPRVQVYRDTHVNQVPSGTHLHPDIAKDMLNRGISEQHTDNAQVKRTITESYDFAADAEHNDKF